MAAKRAKNHSGRRKYFQRENGGSFAKSPNRGGFALSGARSLGLKARETSDSADQISKGLPVASWDNFIRFSGLNNDEVAKVTLVPQRTLSRRREKGKLDPAESDRLMRFSIIVEKAVDLFEGDTVAARHWLRTPQPALGNRTPISFSQTTIGAREVEDLIGRLEHGVYT